jgi:TATA-box binding protein (TBP) (component of TFIID and TFIIIB)
MNIDDLAKEFNTYQKAVAFLDEKKIRISTMTLVCSLGTNIHLYNLSRYVHLDENGIAFVKYGKRNDPATNRTIIYIKPKKKQSKKAFFNQITILMKPLNNPERNHMNIKVFKNGSLQITGCKCMEDFYDVVDRLIIILKKGVYIKKDKHSQKTHRKFIVDNNIIAINNIKVKMINSNFSVNFEMDRKKLDNLIKQHHDIDTFDKELGYIESKLSASEKHSCVDIKYRYDDDNVTSIFIFSTGSVIITGAKNFIQIIGAYIYVNRIIDKYKPQIKTVKLDKDKVCKLIDRLVAEKNLS